MKITEVTKDMYRLSANLSEDVLFEGIWPLPNGISLNSYLVKGESVALIDGVGSWEGIPETMFDQLEQLGIAPGDIDYVIMNHLEPDHTGWFRELMETTKDFTLVSTGKGLDLAKAFYDGEEIDTMAVKSGDQIDLGGGKVLLFEEIPNVHWPETMVTYEKSTKTLFSCDAFGAFGAIGDSPYDDQLSKEEVDLFEREGLRYYANIVATFSPFVQRAVKKLENLEIGIVAPSHGIVWRENPQKIIDDYVRYASYRKGTAKPEITFIWSSMYGMTEKAMEYVVEGIESEGVKVHVHRVPQTHLSYILQSAWESTGIVLAMPTYEYRMFPPMAAIVDDLGRKNVNTKEALRIGSFGWSGGAQRELDQILERYSMNWNMMEPVEFKGCPTESDLEEIRNRSAQLARRVKERVEKN